MDRAEFDRFADEYDAQHRANIAITGEDPEYFARYKADALARIAAALQLYPRRILDFGSGIGNATPHLLERFPEASLDAADVSRRSLDIAESRFPGQARGLLVSGRRIPAADDAFDLSFSACVFHHIPTDQHVHWLREMRRVTRPGGLIVVFEHNPLNPLTVHAVDTCPFDVNARLMSARTLARRYRQAGWLRPRIRYHVFFPRFLSWLRVLEPGLARVPIGAQYSVSAVKES